VERNTNNVTDNKIIKEAAYSVASLIKMKLIQNISIVGSGNVAYHLGIALKNSGLKINFVYARNIEEGTRLAKMLD
jgi:glutamyl-tRNA reductase